MKASHVRRPLLIGLAVFGVIAACFLALRRAEGDASRQAASRPADSRLSPANAAKKTVGTPRSAAGLTIDVQHDISADARPPDARRESIIRTGLGEIQEMQQMNKAVFDDAAKRWNAQPRVKELIERWKQVEETWKTQDDEAKAAVVPQMEAMWKEALGLLREEVERSAREAQAGIR